MFKLRKDSEKLNKQKKTKVKVAALDITAWSWGAQLQAQTL